MVDKPGGYYERNAAAGEWLRCGVSAALRLRPSVPLRNEIEATASYGIVARRVTGKESEHPGADWMELPDGDS